MDDTSRGWGLLPGHQRGPHMATSGDFVTAVDTRPAVSLHLPPTSGTKELSGGLGGTRWRHRVRRTPVRRAASRAARGDGVLLEVDPPHVWHQEVEPLASPTATRVSATITTRSAPHDSPLVVPCPTRTSLSSTSATLDGGALRTSPHMTAETSSRRATSSLHWRRSSPVELRPRRSSLACEAAPLIPIDHVAQACIGGILQDVVKRADLCAGSPQETVQSSLHLDIEGLANCRGQVRDGERPGLRRHLFHPVERAVLG